MASGVPEQALRAMLAARAGAGIEVARFERIFNLLDSTTDAMVAACDAVTLGKVAPVIVSQACIDSVTVRVAEALRRDDRLAIGVAELRAAVAADLPIETFESLLRLQAQGLDISLAAGSVTLRERRDHARQADLVDWQRIRPVLARYCLSPPELSELARDTGVSIGKLRAILKAQARVGEAFQLRLDRYILRELVAQLAMAAFEISQQFVGGQFTAAQYRDHVGTGRTLAIHILEMLDAAGITRRNGDQRTLMRDPRIAFGNAIPFRISK